MDNVNCLSVCVCPTKHTRTRRTRRMTHNNNTPTISRKQRARSTLECGARRLTPDSVALDDDEDDAAAGFRVPRSAMQG